MNNFFFYKFLKLLNFMENLFSCIPTREKSISIKMNVKKAILVQIWKCSKIPNL